jgi:UDP-glucose 4-epimerase
MIQAIRAATGTAHEAWADPVRAPRRAGDPPRVVASVDRIREAIGWTARFGVDEMVRSAWAAWGRGPREPRS